MAMVLRRAIKDNRESSILRVLGCDRRKQIFEAYNQMYNENVCKYLRKCSYGLYKKALAELLQE